MTWEPGANSRPYSDERSRTAPSLRRFSFIEESRSARQDGHGGKGSAPQGARGSRRHFEIASARGSLEPLPPPPTTSRGPWARRRHTERYRPWLGAASRAAASRSPLRRDCDRRRRRARAPRRGGARRGAQVNGDCSHESRRPVLLWRGLNYKSQNASGHARPGPCTLLVPFSRRPAPPARSLIPSVPARGQWAAPRAAHALRKECGYGGVGSWVCACVRRRKLKRSHLCACARGEGSTPAVEEGRGRRASREFGAAARAQVAALRWLPGNAAAGTACGGARDSLHLPRPCRLHGAAKGLSTATLLRPTRPGVPLPSCPAGSLCSDTLLSGAACGCAAGWALSVSCWHNRTVDCFLPQALTRFLAERIL